MIISSNLYSYYFVFGYFIELSWKMPKNSLFKFLSRKFTKAAKVDDAPTYRKYFVPDFSFLEGFDNMSVILDAGPAEQPNVETVEEPRDVPQLESAAQEPMNMEPDTAETASMESEATVTSPMESEAVEPMHMEPDTTKTVTMEQEARETAPMEPDTPATALMEPDTTEAATMEPQAMALAPVEPLATKAATMEYVPTGMKPENWAR